MAGSLRERAGAPGGGLVLYFASCRLDPARTAKAMADAFPGSEVVGCSSCCEYTNAGFTEGGVAALVFGRDAVPAVSAALVTGLLEAAGPKVEEAVRGLAADLGDPEALSQYDRYLGLALMDGLTRSEEAVMERLGDLSHVAFVGGSASDQYTFDRAWVAFRGEAHRAASVLVLARPAVRWQAGMTLSWQAWDAVALTPTRVDLARRRVFELDGRPAIDRYAEVLGFTRDNLDFNYLQISHPLGLVAQGEIFVRAPAIANPDGSIDFFCRLHEGTPLRVLNSTPIVAETAAHLESLRARMDGRVGAVVDFCCANRHGLLKAARQLDAYARLAPETPRAGFATYGEQYLGHMNCTSTMIAFGA